MAKNNQFLEKNDRIVRIYGYHSVKAALKNTNRRKKKLILTESLVKSFKKYFDGKVKEVSIISKKDFEKKYYREENNQGIVLEAYELPRFQLKLYLIKQM